MKLQENVYRVTYKNGYVREWKAYSMSLEDGKLYECVKAYPFDNGIPRVMDASNIESVECIERNNDLDDEEVE